MQEYFGNFIQVLPIENQPTLFNVFDSGAAHVGVIDMSQELFQANGSPSLTYDELIELTGFIIKYR